jgi:hypothetical protein
LGRHRGAQAGAAPPSWLDQMLMHSRRRARKGADDTLGQLVSTLRPTLRHHLQLFEASCHETNFSLSQIVAGTNDGHIVVISDIDAEEATASHAMR